MFLEKKPKIELTKKDEIVELEEQDVKRWKDEDVAVLLGNIMRLKNLSFLKEEAGKYKDKVNETFLEIKDFLLDNGAKYYENVTEMYEEYIRKNKPIIVRKEDPLKVLKLINGEKIEIVFDPEVVDGRGDKYANSALWPNGPVNSTSGIQNAFAEGRGMAGPIALVCGFKNNSGELFIEEPKDKIDFVGNLYRGNVRILSGKINKEDLEFIVLRVMAKFASEEILTSEEKIKLKEGKLEQVIRSFKFK